MAAVGHKALSPWTVIKSDDKITVTQQNDNVVIRSSNPEVVYIPTYEPQMLYDPTYVMPAQPINMTTKP